MLTFDEKIVGYEYSIAINEWKWSHWLHMALFWVLICLIAREVKSTDYFFHVANVAILLYTFKVLVIATI